MSGCRFRLASKAIQCASSDMVWTTLSVRSSHDNGRERITLIYSISLWVEFDDEHITLHEVSSLSSFNDPLLGNDESFGSKSGTVRKPSSYPAFCKYK